MKTNNNLKLTKNIKRPDEKDKDYFSKLLIIKDSLYREEKNMRIINETDPVKYANLCVQYSREALDEIEIDNGGLCKKCKKRSTISQQIQLRAGDEGCSVVERCTNKNCGHVELKSH